MRWVAAAFVTWAQWADFALTKTAMATGGAWEMNPITAAFIDEPLFILYKLALVPLIAFAFAWWRSFNVGLYVSAVLMVLILTWNIAMLYNIVAVGF